MDVFPGFEFELITPAALICIDLQPCGVDSRYGLAKAIESVEPGYTDYLASRVVDTVVPSVARLQEAFHAAGETVVFMTFGSVTGDASDVPTSTIGYRNEQRLRTGGASVVLPRSDRATDVLDALTVAEQDIVLTKTTMDSFASSSLSSILAERRIASVVVTGIYTDACVESTARNAAELGFKVFVPHDGCAAWRQEFHEHSLSALGRYFARVAGSNDIIRELQAGYESV